MHSFEDLGLASEILDAIRKLGFEQPTPIQSKTIPHLLASDQDVIAIAQTGTGKTAAFGLPTIQLTDTNNKNPQTLILCPTRELCLQITKDLQDFSKKTKGLNVVAVYGGARIETQIKGLKKGAHIIVGTPGRTRDLIERKKLVLNNIDRVILDEADEMLTMGFKEELNAILAQTPETKQTLLFSATMSREIKAITKKYMSDAVELSVAKVDMVAKNIVHKFYLVQSRDKYEALKRVADLNPSIYGIVFCRTRRETKEVAGKLMHDGYNADTLHGDLSQAQRNEVMDRFRKRHIQILVATDVAARGLDVSDLTHIINFNIPDDNEVYIHRSGRTGRAGKEGISIAIVHSREVRKIAEIEKKFGISFIKEAVPSGKEICEKQLLALIDKVQNVEVNDKQIEPFLEDIYSKIKGLKKEELIKRFVSVEFNRFLTYYKNARDINISENSKREKDRDRKKKRNKVDYSRLFINIGSKNKLTPQRLMGLINEGLDSSAAKIGQIEIMKSFSFFEIEKHCDKQLIDALNGQTFEGISISVEPSKSKKKESTYSKDGFSRRNRRRDKGKRKYGRKRRRE